MNAFADVLAMARKGTPSPAKSANPPDSIITYLRNLRELLTVRRAAKILGRHPETLYIWISAGLPAHKAGRTWRIDPIRLAAWLETK